MNRRRSAQYTSAFTLSAGGRRAWQVRRVRRRRHNVQHLRVDAVCGWAWQKKASGESQVERHSVQYTSAFTPSACLVRQCTMRGIVECTVPLAQRALHRHTPSTQPMAAASIIGSNRRTCKHGGRTAECMRHRIVARPWQEPAAVEGGKAAGGCSQCATHGYSIAAGHVGQYQACSAHPLCHPASKCRQAGPL